MREFVQWTAPSPLWEKAIKQPTAGLRRAELSRPSILRFATDTFMDDFLKMLETDAKKLDQYVALSETWRGISAPPETLKTVPAFARSLHRLGLVAKRKTAKNNALTQTADQQVPQQNQTAAKLKLYQPAHQRFYMVSACLVCERPGLPDKIPNNGREEKVSYVIRRLFPKLSIDSKTNKEIPLDINTALPPLDSSWEEYAYVITDQGARWKKAAKANALEPAEEQQPLFGVNILEDDGRRRKIFAGVIPTGRREAYMAAGKATIDNAGKTVSSDAPIDSRVYLMRAQFRDPWKNLLQTAAHAQRSLVASMNPAGVDMSKTENVNKAIEEQKKIIKTTREQIQTISWLILLDFAKFLEEKLPRIWATVKDNSLYGSLNQEEKTLFDVLKSTKLETEFADNLKIESKIKKVSGSLHDALLDVRPKTGTDASKIEKNLESVVASYDLKNPDPLYPEFLFALADPGYSTLPPNLESKFALTTVLDGKPKVSITPSNFLKTSLNKPVFAEAKKKNEEVDETKLTKDGEDYVNRIAQLIEDVLKVTPNEPNQPLVAVPLASQTPLDMREGWFVIRCVYERPLCGTIDPPVLSEPTKAFQIAGFFDPDAPARPIRIALPVDITPAGLRKFDRNTAFMMSDLLCGQVNRMKGITFADLVFSILPFPFHKDLSVPDSGGCEDKGLSVGMICSLSIPIITICALILLIIIVMLLDFIFKWLPFLIFCFPLPGLKGKDE